MAKHVLDRPKTVSTKDVVRAVTIEQQKHPHRATLTLQRRSRQRDLDQRAKFYAQILRDEV